MNKFLVVFVASIILFSCQKKEVAKVDVKKDSANCVSKEKKFEMYEMSEMAALMEQMYVENLRLKDKISKGETVGKFPEYYSKIHTSKFTDETDNDAFFKEHATLFIASQKLIYSVTNLENAKKNFNLGVDACIKCHENKCGGPIPKIKKLYLK